MANKPKPPSAQPGKHFFDGKSLAEASPEELDKALDNILDVMDADEEQKKILGDIVDNVDAANDVKPQLHLTRPADRSLEAFKTWITDLAERLVPGAPNDVTESQWVEKHEEFWKRLDKGLAKKNNKTAT